MHTPSVIYEDEHLVAVNKPSGLVMHAGIGTGFTLADWVARTYPGFRDIGEPFVGSDGRSIPRFGIAHRLDKGTSGALLLAKNQPMFSLLKRHFQNRAILKEYHAFVHGRPPRERGIVSLAIGKSRHDFRRQTTRSIRGPARDARTEYVVAGRCPDDISFVRFYPRTGRAHQVRAHARSLHTPIVGDSLYAASREPALGFSRPALHAYRITVPARQDGDPLHIVAPYPDDFAHALSFCSPAVSVGS